MSVLNGSVVLDQEVCKVEARIQFSFALVVEMLV